MITGRGARARSSKAPFNDSTQARVRRLVPSSEFSRSTDASSRVSTLKKRFLIARAGVLRQAHAREQQGCNDRRHNEGHFSPSSPSNLQLTVVGVYSMNFGKFR